MLTEYEARKLQEDMKRELDGSPALVLTSFAGLLIVLAFSLMGSTANPDRESDRASQDAAERRDRPVAAEVTEQFAEESRERFQSPPAAGVARDEVDDEKSDRRAGSFRDSPHAGLIP